MSGAQHQLPNLTLPQMLRYRAQQAPDRVALRQKEHGIWTPVTWRQYYERSCAVALALRHIGVDDGAHVGILSENCLEWVLAQLGIGIANGVTVGIYPTSPANEVAYVMEHADVEVVFCEDQEQVDKVLEIRDQLPRLRKIIAFDMRGLSAYGDEQMLSFEALEQRGARLHHEDEERPEALLDRHLMNGIGLMVYTSGSTGKPKGAMISWRNIVSVAPGAIERLGLDSTTTMLSYLPLCHVAEQMLTTFVHIYAGCRTSFGESLRTVQEDLREVAPTAFLGVPRIWEKMHAAIHLKISEAGGLRRWLFERALRACTPFADKYAGDRTLREKLIYAFWYPLILRSLQNFSGLRRLSVALTGAAPISPHVVRFFRAIGIPLVEVYGMTETSGMITGPHVSDAKVGTIGFPIVGAEYRIGEHNELHMRGAMIFEGYYKNPQATQATLRDGWLHTGDVVEPVGDMLKIVDRLKDIMITAGGKNLSPSEIENTHKSSPYVKECIVIGEGRKYVSALIQIDLDTVQHWAESHGIAYTTFRSLAEHPEVCQLIQDEVDKSNSKLASVARVKRFHLLTKELDHDDDEVTATMKIRRSNIYQKYAKEIAALYGEGPAVAAGLAPVAKSS